MQIELDHVSVECGAGQAILTDLNLSIPSGQVCAVMGASGSGKTTLLRLLGGHLAPSGGIMRIDGQPADRKHRQQLAAAIGQIYQDHRLVGPSTAAANIAQGAAAAFPMWRKLLGSYPAWARQRATLLAEGLELDGAIMARPVNRLSGGQQQRVGIARALMLPTRLILVDEPVASLEPELARQVLETLRQHAAFRSATVLCSLHQPEFARRFADRIIVLDKGRIVHDGPPPRAAQGMAA